MKIVNCLKSLAFIALAMTMATMTAANVDSRAAQAKAVQFLNSLPGTRMMASSTNMKLTHAEPSAVNVKANDFYVFNYDGGGYVIVSGDDRAEEILGYGSGRIDMNNLPSNVAWWINHYKEQMEWLIANPQAQVETTTQLMSTMFTATTVPMLMTSTWDQEEPYYNQCPKYNGSYCMTGCVATAMAQVMYYWRYPVTSPELNSYYCYDIGQTVPALPETTFSYDKMLPSYCHWDWDQSELIQDVYTTEQANAVAKLSRYCGQAVNMGYSPEGSGAYVSSQLSAMIEFGYSSDARDVSRSSWWGSDNYTTAQWEAMVKEELDKRQPILYSASDPMAGGHAFICDGYNSEGLLHFNFGWYGTCDGWYVSTALNMTHRDGDALKFNSGHEILLGVVPPTYCVIQATDVNAPSGLIVLGEQFNVQASDVNILTTNGFVNLIFSVNNEVGRRMVTSPAIKVTPSEFEQGSTVQQAMTLTPTLAAGTYTLGLYYYTNSSRMTTAVDCQTCELNVIGNLAKFNEPFNIVDVTTAIDYLLQGDHGEVNIVDITSLIDLILA